MSLFSTWNVDAFGCFFVSFWSVCVRVRSGTWNVDAFGCFFFRFGLSAFVILARWRERSFAAPKISYHTIPKHIKTILILYAYHTITYHKIRYHTIYPYYGIMQTLLDVLTPTIPYHTIPYHTLSYNIISYIP